MKVLVVDVGGTHVKVLVSGQNQPRKFVSGPTMTPNQMVAGVKKITADWKYDVAAVGFPGPVKRSRPLTEPHNLAPGWVKFNFETAFGCPVRLINDAAMQALGSYKGGVLLFLGLGTGLGSALIDQGVVIPMEFAHFPYKNGTFEDYLGLRGIERFGKKKWRKYVDSAVASLIAALNPDDVVIGGGNAKLLKQLPPGCRAGNNANAFIGGFRLWEEPRIHQLAPVSKAAPTRAQASKSNRIAKNNNP